jgi:hypothetical protein
MKRFNSEQEASEPLKNSMMSALPWVAGVVAVLLIVLYAKMNESLSLGNPETLGQFGDYIGGLLNPLISLLTLTVAIQVWKLQKKELLETRKALELQTAVAEDQRREQRFFDIFKIYQQSLDSISVAGSFGKSALTLLHGNGTGYSSLDRYLGLGGLPREHWISGKAPEDGSQYSKDSLCDSWNGYSSGVDHYFRTVFVLLNEAEQLLQKEHFRYIELFRAQLTQDELSLLGCRLIFGSQGPGDLALVEKYGLLKDLTNEMLRQDLINENLGGALKGRVSTEQ